MFELLVPGDVQVGETAAVGNHALLGPGETAAVRSAAPRRVAEFSTGRACARAALRKLGFVGEPAIPVAPSRAPDWPAGIVGSITHDDGFVAAAVGWRRRYRAIGIDTERTVRVEDAVVTEFASEDELASAEQVVRGVAAPLLVFSAKESVYKIWGPLVGTWLGFDHVDVRFGRDRSFVVSFQRPHPSIGSVVRGRFLYADGRVATAVVVPE